MPSVGYKVFHVARLAKARLPTPKADGESSLDVTATTLENNRLTVRIDRNGDIASIYDKDAKRELLSAPVMLELRDNLSPPWPAWEVLYDTVQVPAREYVVEADDPHRRARAGARGARDHEARRGIDVRAARSRHRRRRPR